MKTFSLRVVRVVVAVLLVVAISGVALARDPGVDVTSAPVPITIESRPEYAEVYLDGKFIGSGPITPRLRPGEYNLELRRPGFAVWKRVLTVRPSGESRVVALLERAAK